jgi:hypothetical protein
LNAIGVQRRSASESFNGLPLSLSSEDLAVARTHKGPKCTSLLEVSKTLAYTAECDSQTNDKPGVGSN